MVWLLYITWIFILLWSSRDSFPQGSLDSRESTGSGASWAVPSPKLGTLDRFTFYCGVNEDSDVICEMFVCVHPSQDPQLAACAQ